jgi:hypothetical protein
MKYAHFSRRNLHLGEAWSMLKPGPSGARTSPTPAAPSVCRRPARRW